MGRYANTTYHKNPGSSRNYIIFLEASCGGEDPGKHPMRLRFIDKGLGIREETAAAMLRELDKDRTHALGNIYHRMKLCFGASFDFTIRSKFGCYTVIEMLIPGETELGIPEIK
jgi:LytS/YehU family sensor histidine kinase